MLLYRTKKRGGENLYISDHPSVEPQGFYVNIGC